MRLGRGDFHMFMESKKEKGLFEESSPQLAKDFIEAGMGFEKSGKAYFHPLEAAYLARLGKSSFSAFQSAEKFANAWEKSHKGFRFAFAVYFAIRKTGRLARPYANDPGYLRAYAPGVGRLEQRPSQLVYLAPGKMPSAKTLQGQVQVAHLARLDLIVACGTEEEIKYYKISSFNF